MYILFTTRKKGCIYSSENVFLVSSFIMHSKFSEKFREFLRSFPGTLISTSSVFIYVVSSGAQTPFATPQSRGVTKNDAQPEPQTHLPFIDRQILHPQAHHKSLHLRDLSCGRICIIHLRSIFTWSLQ